MDERQIQESRRARLADAVRKLAEGNVASFGRLLGYRGGAFVRQMLQGNRAISDKTVRHIENLRGMQGWFSLAPTPAVHEASAEYDCGAGPEVYELRPVQLRVRPGLIGYTVLPDDNDEDAPLLLHRRWLARRSHVPARLLALRVKTGGMEPSLHVGNVFVIDTAETLLRDGQVFAINFYGEVLVRRIQRDGGWWLVADHPDQARYPRKACAGPDCVPIGREVFKQGEHI